MDLDTKVICWDLDNTLGEFSDILSEMSIEREMGRHVNPFASVSLRKGIRETLEILSQKGFVHYVTSNNPIEYINKAVERAGLKSYFKDTFAYDPVKHAGFGKLYRQVAERHNFNDEDARARMVIIGDASQDQPADLSGVVFLHDPSGPYTPSEVLQQAIYRLLEAGNNNFNAGFDALHGNSLSLSDGINLRFDYKLNPVSPGIIVPTVTIDIDKGVYFQLRRSGLDLISPRK